MTLDTKEGVKDYFRQLEEWTASDRVDETEDLAKINEHMDWALNEKERQIRALYGILKDKGEEIERLRKEIEKAEWEREQMRVARDAERSKAEMVVARDRVRIMTLEKQKKVIRRALLHARGMTVLTSNEAGNRERMIPGRTAKILNGVPEEKEVEER